MGDVFRCNCDDGAVDRWLELPAWMFDRTACASTHASIFPLVEVAALRALRRLLTDQMRDPQAVGASLNAPILGSVLGSHDQNRRESHATGEQASSSASKRERAVRSVPIAFSGGHHRRYATTDSQDARSRPQRPMPLWLWQEVQILPWSTEIVALTCGTRNSLRPPYSSVHGKIVAKHRPRPKRLENCRL